MRPINSTGGKRFILSSKKVKFKLTCVFHMYSPNPYAHSERQTNKYQKHYLNLGSYLCVFHGVKSERMWKKTPVGQQWGFN